MILSFSRMAAARRIRLDAQYYVYIMSSPSMTLYTGVTNDLARHVFEHKALRPGLSPVDTNELLVYFEEFGDISQVIARAKEIKSVTRKPKIRLVEWVNTS